MLDSVGAGPVGSGREVIPGRDVRVGMEVAVAVEVSGAAAEDSEDTGRTEERSPAAEVVVNSGMAVVCSMMEAEVVAGASEGAAISALEDTAADVATTSTPETALLDATTALLEATTDDEAATVEEDATAELEAPSAAAQAKLIFCVKVPVLFGALKSQVIAT